MEKEIKEKRVLSIKFRSSTFKGRQKKMQEYQKELLTNYDAGYCKGHRCFCDSDNLLCFIALQQRFVFIHFYFPPIEEWK